MSPRLRDLLAVYLVQLAKSHPKPDAGIYKSTLASSDPLGTARPWMLRYLPVYSASNSCDNGNNTCECGATGRMEVNGTTGFEPEFGVHTVLAAGRDGSRSKASGPLSVAEIEAIWDEELGDLSDEKRGYDGWVDNHLALWTPSLAPFLARFEADHVPFMARSWLGEDDSIFFSAIVHAPKTQLVLELISNTTGGHVGRWPLQQESRHLFQGQDPPTTEFGYLAPLHVSRSAHDLDEIQTFYSQVFDVLPTVRGRYDDGTEVLVLGGAPGDSFSSRVALQFVRRGQGRTPLRHSAEWFQDYMLNVSSTYMVDYKSCWPVWGDNHIALATETSLDVIKDRMDRVNDSMYHPFHGITPPGSSFGGPSVIYLVDPSGWTVQVSGQWPNGFLPDADTDNGNFYEYCFEFCDEQIAPQFV